MRAMRIALAAVPAAAMLTIVASAPAEAKCTRLGFSVNDYGKEGPARDAQNLLDKYIATWTAENGIKSYRVGKKDVTCELFLDFGFFDEYTCKATAAVCWGDGATGAEQAATPAGNPPAQAPRPEGKKAKPAESAAAAKPARAAAPKAAAPVATGTVAPSAKKKE